MKSDNELPAFVLDNSEFALSNEYVNWINDVKKRFQRGQIKASIRVNDAMLEFYWSLGRGIVELQKKYGWGSGVIKQTSLDLKNSSVGLLICKSKDETTVKWSFKDINKPIGVAEYKLKEIVERTLNYIKINE